MPINPIQAHTWREAQLNGPDRRRLRCEAGDESKSIVRTANKGAFFQIGQVDRQGSLVARV